MTGEATVPPASPSRPPLSLPARFVLICLGYIVAVAAATLATVALMLAPAALPDNGAQGSFFAVVAELGPPMLAVGFGWTFMCALPGFVVAIIAGEMWRWRNWWTYGLAGLVNVVPALLIFAAFEGVPFAEMIAASFPGGFAGGAAYWAAAGRFVANRRSSPA